MTPAAQRVYDEIAKNQRTIVVGPSIRDVAAAIGVGGFAVQRQIAKLRKDGVLAPEAGNGLVLVAQPNTETTANAYPLIEVKSRSHKPKPPPNYGVPSFRAPIPRPNGKL